MEHLGEIKKKGAFFAGTNVLVNIAYIVSRITSKTDTRIVQVYSKIYISAPCTTNRYTLVFGAHIAQPCSIVDSLKYLSA